MRRERDVRVSGILRAGLVVLAVFAAAWGCAILWWRSSGAVPGGGAMLLWLVLVPLTVLAGFWMVGRVRRRTASGEQTGPAETLAVDEEPLPPLRPLGVLAQAVNLPCGDDAAVLVPHLAQLPRPGLHPSLRDRDGLPVLAAFVEDLDPDLVEVQLHKGSGRHSAAEHLRAVALLEPVALELFDAAARLLPPPPQAEERVIAGLRRRVESAPTRVGTVHVLAWLPQDMPSPLRAAAGQRLRSLALDAGLDPQRSTFEVLAVGGPDDVWERMRVLSAEPAETDADWHLLLAAASLVGDSAVQGLAAQGRLASGRNAAGVVPGEGAAGVLLRPGEAVLPQAPTDSAVDLLAVRREPAQEGATPRQAGRTSAGLLQALLDAAAVPHDSVAMVLSDADQRPDRSVETAVAAANACPELDPALQCPALGHASGYLGHVSPVALIALAAAAARDAAAPVLTLSVDPARMRYAALLAAAAAPDQSQSSDAGPEPGLAA